MAENIPPATASSTGAANAVPVDQPGRPYYESLRTALRATLDRKRKLDEQLAALEEGIFKAEGHYLEETANSGNIVRGFDGWVKGVAVAGGGGVGGRGGADTDRRRGGGGGGSAGAGSGRAREEDRVFSRSSVSWMRAQEGTDSGTPSHAATPTGSSAPALPGSGRENSAPATGQAGRPTNKKKRANTDKIDESEENGKAIKRGKITYARE